MDNWRNTYGKVHTSGELIRDLTRLETTDVEIVHLGTMKLILKLKSGKFLYVYTDLPGAHELEAYLLEELV